MKIQTLFKQVKHFIYRRLEQTRSTRFHSNQIKLIVA